MKKVLVAVYGHPEGYPPTLNAITELSHTFEHVYLIGRNVLIPTWDYPRNCSVSYSSEYADVRVTERKSILKKIKYYIDFLYLLYRQVKLNKPDVILAYDTMALFGCWLMLPFLKRKPIFWYHNHDIFEEDKVRKYSLQWLSGKFEKRIFNSLHIFSLPSNERKKHFSMGTFKGRYFFLPNYPAEAFFGKFYQPKIVIDNVKLIFQGAIAEGHGLEEITALLNRKVMGKGLHLTLKGWVRDSDFKTKIESIARKINCQDRLQFVGYGPYKELPKLTSSNHIGIGIHAHATNLHSTLGTASNKLYEYAAVGLPIIVFDNPHYRTHLSKFPWVFFTDLSETSLIECIHQITSNYSELSLLAFNDFKNELNFELNFRKILTYLQTLNVDSLRSKQANVV